MSRIIDITLPFIPALPYAVTQSKKAVAKLRITKEYVLALPKLFTPVDLDKTVSLEILVNVANKRKTVNKYAPCKPKVWTILSLVSEAALGYIIYDLKQIARVHIEKKYAECEGVNIKFETLED